VAATVDHSRSISKWVPHPADSPDTVSSNFFLFGNIEENLTEYNFLAGKT
jgi:hypothetical protein